MCYNGVIHVFVGAPVIAPSFQSAKDRSASGGGTAVWRDIPYAPNELDACRESGRHHQKLTEKCTEPAFDRQGEADETFARTCNQETDLGQKMATDMREVISDLASSTELCHITYSVQSDDCNECTDLDVIRSDTSSSISAETEFLTILASSQLVVQSPGNDGTKVANRSPRPSESVLKDMASDCTATGSASQDAFTSSSDLFTDTPDEVFDKKTLESQKNEHIESESAAERSHFEDNFGSSNIKRKNSFSESSPSSNHNQQSKKSKQSTSPASATKKSNKLWQQTPAKSLTLLKHCSDMKKEYNVMVVVLQPCHVKEIKVKSGPNVGSTFPLAKIVVIDQSEVKREVLMWRTAAFWSLGLLPGEIIVLTNLSICEDRWRGDIFLQSSFRSKLVNLGSCSVLCSIENSNTVENSAVKELLNYIHKKHIYLRELSPRQTQMLEHIQYVSLAYLQPELLLHSMLKVIHISILKEATYHFKGTQQNKIILTVEQICGQTSTLVLWGTCVSWCDQIHLKRDHIWVFKYLFCKKNIISGDLELHTTPWSSWECLFHDDQRAIDFRKQYNKTSEKQMSLLSMVQDRCSGEIQVKGSILQLEFKIPGKPKILMSSETSISDILEYLPYIKYTGCGKCKRELNIDDNDVYEQCYVCLPFNQICIFYRSAQMTIMSEGCFVSIQVPPDILEKMFLNISPKLLNHVFPSCPDVTYGTIVADLCYSLLAKTEESFIFTIKSQFMLDENSMPLEEDFHLLDFHLDL
ncbi:hypothetical protein GDO81_018053 [Engystomops pustulosus]|uniref:Shieldin complex subunit 2 n=1 Tax=Engystomops pustulosus TaxID=76066 RepID=A0AAV7A459_ENGPU|nr:hypothetical protein GDO81_018053 [Engystomops pustulosus]